MHQRAMCLLLTAVLAGASLVTGAQAEVTIRIASDTVGPPHPAGIAMEIFKEKVEAARGPGLERIEKQINDTKKNQQKKDWM